MQVRQVCLFVGSLTSQQHASVSHGRICSDNSTCCHTEIEVADQTFHLTQSQYTDTGPTSLNADPITQGAWQVSHWSANKTLVWLDLEKSRRKRVSNPESSAFEADALTTRPTRRSVRHTRSRRRSSQHEGEGRGVGWEGREWEDEEGGEIRGKTTQCLLQSMTPQQKTSIFSQSSTPSQIPANLKVALITLMKGERRKEVADYPTLTIGQMCSTTATLVNV